MRQKYEGSMAKTMFTTLIVRPIFNLLVLIYTILPGHNFGFAIILFTILVRLLMWPLVKKQLHNAKAMRKLQPEMKRIKKEAAGDKQKESTMVMELYKERGVNPFSSIGIVILQLPILIGLYSGIRRIITSPNNIVTFSYPFLQHMSWLRELAGNIGKFDHTLFGVVDLTRSAIEKSGGIYWPAMVLVLGSAVSQYYQSKQLMPNDKDARKLRDILKGAGGGEKADQSEVNAAVGRSTRFFIPVMIFFFTVNIASALSLYWLVSGIVAIIQQNKVLGSDEEELEALASRPDAKTSKTTEKRKVIEGEVIEKPKTNKNVKKTSQKKSKKRRR
jgi:YidC/Oxa1 family membrane protein insertase